MNKLDSIKSESLLCMARSSILEKQDSLDIGR